MEREYTTPEMVVMGLETEDVITTSRLTGGTEGDNKFHW